MQNKTYAAADLVKYKAGDFSESEWTYVCTVVGSFFIFDGHN